MPEPHHHDLPEPERSPLPARPAGTAWQRAKDGLPVPEPVSQDPMQSDGRTRAQARATWSCLRPRHAGPRPAENQ